MRVPLVCAVVVALVAAAAAQRSSATTTDPVRAAKTPAAVLGLSYRSPQGALAWFDPLTLRMLPGRKAPLGGHFGSWAFSADRRVLAIASCGEGLGGGIRFVNARAMRVLGDLRLSSFADCTSSLTWLAPRRLLALAQSQTGGHASMVLVDPVARRVLRRESLPAGHWTTGRTRDELVLLLGNHGSFAPARLAVVDAEGGLRITTIHRVIAGSMEQGEGAESRSRVIQPGLAVDPEGRRAFLIPNAGPAAEIDLETLGVSYHELDRPSLLGRFLRWLTPTAEAKALEGPIRNARWLGDGMLAVSGVDYSMSTNAKGEPQVVASPAGVTLVDTRSWRTRMLTSEGSGFAAAEGMVIAQGGRSDAEEQVHGPGLQAFGLDGRERWQLHPGEYLWMDTAGPVGYVRIDDLTTEIVDLLGGSIHATVRWDVRSPRIQQPQLLAAQGSNW